MTARSAKADVSLLAPALVVPSENQNVPATGDAKVPPNATVRTTVIPPCPECLKEGIVRNDFASKAEWGRHRRAKHGVVGSSPTAKQRLRQKENQQHRTFASEDTHNATNQRANHSAKPAQESSSENSYQDRAVIFAAGRITQILDDCSRQAKVSFTEFAQAVWELLSSEEDR